MSIIKHTDAETIALFDKINRPEVAAIRWLLAAGVPEGFIGPVWNFNENLLVATCSLYWKAGEQRVIARANCRSEFMVGVQINDGMHNADTNDWFTDREEWRSAVLKAVEAISVFSNIQCEVKENTE